MALSHFMDKNSIKGKLMNLLKARGKFALEFLIQLKQLCTVIERKVNLEIV
jgi:hypothetical protein